MRKIFGLLIALTLSACVSTTPNSYEEITKAINIEEDSFKQEVWVSTPLYLSRDGLTDKFPVQIMYQALFRKKELSKIQLYLSIKDIEWGYYESAVSEDGSSLDFVKFDSNVSSAGGMVMVNEIFLITLSASSIEKMKQKNWKIRVYGKRKEGTFTIPKQLTEAFSDKLSCYRDDKCTPS